MTDLVRTGHSPAQEPSFASPCPSPLAAHAAPSFDDVYNEHVAFVWRTARALGVSETNADDLVQEVFLVVHRKLGSFEGRSNLRTWLVSIVVNCIRNSRRRERRKGNHVPLDEDVRDQTPDPTRIAETNSALSLVRVILDRMNADQREVFALMEMEELSAPETAEVLSLPLNTVYSRLRLARAFFQREALLTDFGHLGGEK